MTTTSFLLTVAGIGLGTFLIRYLPFYWSLKGQGLRALSGRWRRAINAVGPAAIVSLLTVALSGLMEEAATNSETVAVVLGMAAVYLGKRYLRDVAAATFAGVLAYTLTLYLL